MSGQPFDFEQMTLNEVETIENLTGTAIDKLVADGTPKGKNLKAIIFVLGRRTNPDFTIEDAGNYTLVEAMKVFGVEEDPKGAN
jgi:hypothetical protein